MPRLTAAVRGYDGIIDTCGLTHRGAAAAVLGGTALLGAGCAADRLAAPAQESAARPIAASALVFAWPPRSPAARYLAIATAGNRRLNADFDPLEGRDRNDLARAQTDLRDAAATERWFDRRLLQIAFPSEAERTAHELDRVNQARARLTTIAAASRTLPRLHAYERRLNAADRPVEQAVRTIRRQLGLPPPPSS